MSGKIDKNDQRRLNSILGTLTLSEGGLYKRIDENRELVELLLAEAGEFVRKHPWALSWLESADRFLTDLAEDSGIENVAGPHRPPRTFPRPWPETAPTAQNQNMVAFAPTRSGMGADLIARGCDVSAPAPPSGSVLEYLTGCHPPLDLLTIQSVLHELHVAPDLQEEVAIEIRFVWSTGRLSDDHRTPERVLEYAKDLACQAARALDVPGRIPRAALIAAYKKIRRSGTGGA